MWTDTKFTSLVKIPYPIVQGPFGGKLSSVELTSVVSNLGGLGSFGAQPYTYDEMIQFINAIREKTDKPFAINLWESNEDDGVDSYSETDYEKLKGIFQPYFDEYEIPFPEKLVNQGPKYEEQIQAVLDACPPVFSFVYGIPSEKILEECRRKNIITIGTATTPDEAIAIEKAGVDAVVATGMEAGGHRVSFLKPAEESLMGLVSLIPQVADSVSIPVIAAGGIADGRGIKAALALGAEAVQIGTAFLATQQSNASDIHRQRIFSEEAKYTVLTKLFTGRLGRGIKSRLTEELKEFENQVAPYPLQRYFMSALQNGVLAKNKLVHYTSFAGQSASLVKIKDAKELFNSLIKQVDNRK